MDGVHHFLELRRPGGWRQQVRAIISVVIMLCFTQSPWQLFFLCSRPSFCLSSLHGFYFDLFHFHLLLLHLLLLTSLCRFLRHTQVQLVATATVGNIDVDPLPVISILIKIQFSYQLFILVSVYTTLTPFVDYN